MRKILFTSIVASLLFTLNNNTIASDDNWFFCQKSNQNNGYIIAGGYNVNANPLSTVAFTKIDNTGNIIWQKSLTGNADFLIPYTLNKGQSNYYTCGLTYANGFGPPGDAYVMAFNENGVKQWDWLGGEDNVEVVYGVCEKNNGEVITTGFTNSFSTINDLLVVKLSAAGNLMHSKIVFNNTNNTEQGLKVKATADGGYVILGIIKTGSTNDLLLIKYNASDNITWAKQYSLGLFYDPIDVIEANNGNFIVVGGNTVAGSAANNLLRVTSSGNVLWFKTFSTNTLERPSLVREQNNNIYVSGMAEIPGSAGTLDAQFFATDANGNLLFSNKINVNGMDGKRIGCIETDAINQNEITMVMGEFVSTPRLFEVGVQKVSMHSTTCNNEEYPLTEGTLTVTETSLNLNEQNISLFEFNGFNSQNITEFSNDYCEQTVFPYFEVNVNPCTGVVTTSNLTTNGNTYSWNFGDGATSNQTNPSYTYTGAGTFTITLFATDNMGNTDWYDVEVTIGGGGNFANAGNNVSICEGDSTPLNASGGSSYSWSPSAGLNNSNISNPTASPTSTTTYTVTVTDANGCSDTDQVTVTVNPLPTNVSFSIQAVTSSNSPINLSGSPAGGVFSGMGIIFNAFNPGIAGLGQHTITYTYTDANGCSASDQQSILVFVVYFNFVNYNLGTISPKLIDFEQNLSLTDQAELSIYNLNGQVVHQIKTWGIKDTFSQLLQQLKSGHYVYTISDQQKMISGKIVIAND